VVIVVVILEYHRLMQTEIFTCAATSLLTYELLCAITRLVYTCEMLEMAVQDMKMKSISQVERQESGTDYKAYCCLRHFV